LANSEPTLPQPTMIICIATPLVNQGSQAKNQDFIFGF